jgi:hypothetical protein
MLWLSWNNSHIEREQRIANGFYLSKNARPNTFGSRLERVFLSPFHDQGEKHAAREIR